MSYLPATADTINLSKREIQRAVLASIIGNGLEWFDFIVMGSFVTLIANVFFQTHHRSYRFYRLSAPLLRASSCGRLAAFCSAFMPIALAAVRPWRC
jgi:hypothetical protein